MPIPNDRHVVQSVYDNGDYNLDDHEDLARFVDDAVYALHKHDENWVHIKKRPGQTQVHGHGEDAALYLLPDNKAQACDFVQGAGAPGAKLRWGPDPEPYYKHSDGWDAHNQWTDEEPEPPPTNPKPPASIPPFPPRDETLGFGMTLNEHYRMRGAGKNGTLGGTYASYDRHTDVEGEQVWTSEYLRRRQLGESHLQATDNVLKDVDAAWPK